MRTIRYTILTLLLASAALAYGQQPVQAKPADQSKEQTKEAPKPAPATKTYLVEYTLYEMEDGKKINSRTYKTELTEESSIKMNARVPVQTGSGMTPQFQYLDVGLAIHTWIRPEGDRVHLDARVDITDFALPPSNTTNPVSRSSESSAELLVQLGKRMQVFAIDDMNSKRTYYIETLVTQI